MSGWILILSAESKAEGWSKGADKVGWANGHDWWWNCQTFRICPPYATFYASAAEIVTQCTIKPLPLSLSKTDSFIPPYQPPLIPTVNCPKQGRNQLNSDAFKTKTYPITRRLFVIIKQDGQGDERAGEAYALLLLTDDGKSWLKRLAIFRDFRSESQLSLFCHSSEF